MQASIVVTRRLAMSAVLALVISAALSLGCARAATAAPRLRLAPASGAAGTQVGVSGAGFTPRARVTLAWDGASAGLPSATTTASGAFSVAWRVPAGALAGDHTLSASAGATGSAVTFRVVPQVGMPTPGTPAADSWWLPALTTSWQIQYSGQFDASVDVTLYDVDGFDTDAATVAALHAQDRKVACYISAGSWEDWRPDAGQFPERVKGASNGWPGERRLDIRQLDTLLPLLGARLDMCKAMGFDAVGPDNLDGYANDSGFPLTAADQLAFNRAIAAAAHARGLAAGLKNDGDQATALAPNFDFAVVEQCFEYDECDLYAPFTAAGKPVFAIEYDLSTAAFCADADRLNVNALRKHMQLDAWREACR